VLKRLHTTVQLCQEELYEDHCCMSPATLPETSVSYLTLRYDVQTLYIISHLTSMMQNQQKSPAIYPRSTLLIKVVLGCICFLEAGLNAPVQSPYFLIRSRRPVIISSRNCAVGTSLSGAEKERDI
jgi:hypothetical protein